jgi:uncharacterized protein (DUF924 family)
MATLDPLAADVLSYWFGDAPDGSLDELRARTRFWFARNGAVDAEVTKRFASLVERAQRGELDEWAKTPKGRLALIILLDQFPRNLHRDSKEAFATDLPALRLTLEGLDAGVDRELGTAERLVFYLPLVHSEELAHQERAVELFRRNRDEGRSDLVPELETALGVIDRHRYIVERFGRFPHRNEVLGRESTVEELAFLAGPNSAF